jgi:L-ascorbate metabolism protein UlaG (beta-lactamase superfamily)
MVGARTSAKKRYAMALAMTKRLTWLGHATVLIELGRAALLTDPVLRPRVAHLRRQVPTPQPPPRVDAVLLSHLHRDHFDLRSLQLVDPAAPVVVPKGGAAALRRARREVHELAPGEVLELAGAHVRAVPAIHHGRRSPMSWLAGAVGYVVEAGRRVYFAGDTERFEAMADLAPVDAALLPIWGWGPRLGAGHMGPDDAAQAVASLRPSLVVPIHWGTFLPIGLRTRDDHILREPVRAFERRLNDLAPDVLLGALAPGESVALE